MINITPKKEKYKKRIIKLFSKSYIERELFSDEK